MFFIIQRENLINCKRIMVCWKIIIVCKSWKRLISEFVRNNQFCTMYIAFLMLYYNIQYYCCSLFIFVLNIMNMTVVCLVCFSAPYSIPNAIPCPHASCIHNTVSNFLSRFLIRQKFIHVIIQSMYPWNIFFLVWNLSIEILVWFIRLNSKEI